MNNRIAFIDFVRGLLTISPLERWSPQQAKLHPFITQQKYTGAFVPPMNLKSSSLNRTPAPGTQQQQQAAELSKQRAQAAQAQAAAAAQGAYGMQQHGYPQSPHAQPPMYPNNNMYSPGGSHVGAPPPYGGPAPQGYGQMVMGQPPAQMPPAQMPPANYAGVPPQQNLYQQATVRAGRQRANTMDQQQNGIPASIQRVASHLDPNHPIRLQPSPAYYPPPADGGNLNDPNVSRVAGRRDSRAQRSGGRGNNRDFIRNLEERTLEEGFMGGHSPWH
jgi:dual specificity protein kinase YAK1